MSKTVGIERLGRFPAGCRVQRGGGMGVKNYTSISCHSDAFYPPLKVGDVMWWFENWPMRYTQSWLLALLGLSAIAACFTFYLLFWGPQCGRFCHAHRWAGTVSGLLVCTAFFQFGTTRWMAHVEAVYLDAERFPFGPPSPITRAIIVHPDYPMASALRHFIFYDPTFAAMLGFGAGAFAILSYWID